MTTYDESSPTHEPLPTHERRYPTRNGQPPNRLVPIVHTESGTDFFSHGKQCNKLNLCYVVCLYATFSFDCYLCCVATIIFDLKLLCVYFTLIM